MAKPHGTDASGRPVNLIGQPMGVRPSPPPALYITQTENIAMAKVEQNGVYVLNGKRYRIRKGDVLPEGAQMEQRAKKPAPENRAEKAAPENRAATSTKKAD